MGKTCRLVDERVKELGYLAFLARKESRHKAQGILSLVRTPKGDKTTAGTGNESIFPKVIPAGTRDICEGSSVVNEGEGASGKCK